MVKNTMELRSKDTAQKIKSDHNFKKEKSFK